MPTIVYPATIDYAWLYQRPQQLLKQLAALGYKVIYYNSESYIKQKSSIIELFPNFLLCKPDIPFKYLKIDEPIINWITYPLHISLIGGYNEDLIVFDAIDESSEEFGDWAGYIDKISARSDVIFTTSKKLYNYHVQSHDNVHMCPNGADYNHFSRAQRIFDERPADLPQNHKPIVGYFGALASWLDWRLINYISRMNRDLNFVIIGPYYGDFKNIVKRENIYYLGRKDYTRLPAYLQYFDVCILPFRITPMTEACNPVKMYEYLSAGKPVVSTSLPEVSGIKEIYTGNNQKEFNQKIKQALSERFDLNKINERIKFARKNSWKQRAIKAADIIEKNLRKKRKYKLRNLWSNINRKKPFY